MSKRRGVSAEEKRERMLQLFYEKKDVFQLKELEKIAPKEKGIVAQSVKEVVQSLVDDCLVDTDKIGTSVYFWAFPSKAVNSRQQKLAELENKLSEARKKLKNLKSVMEQAQSGREDSEERSQVLEELQENEKKLKNLKAEVQKYRDCDPEVLEEVKQQAVVGKEAANRWTDNVFSIKSWCKKKFYMEDAVLNKQFGIPEDFDYIE